MSFSIIKCEAKIIIEYADENGSIINDGLSFDISDPTAFPWSKWCMLRQWIKERDAILKGIL